MDGLERTMGMAPWRQNSGELRFVELDVGVMAPDVAPTIRRRLYGRAGVQEYWLVDPEIDVVRVCRRDGDSFTRAEELSCQSGDVLRSALLPALDLPLTRIFRNT
jgi:hypothetical protein